LHNLEERSFSFKDLLEMEILKAKTYKTKFSLVKIIINDYDELKIKLHSTNKLEIVTTAIKRQFKKSLKIIDLVYYDSNGTYYIILSNAADINITDIVQNLAIPKKMESSITITFSYGIAYFFEKDTLDAIMYRCNKSLETFQANQHKKDK
jgi:hypothetical protein